MHVHVYTMHYSQLTLYHSTLDSTNNSVKVVFYVVDLKCNVTVGQF